MMSNANVMLHKSTSVLPKKRGELSASTKCEWMSRSAMRMPVSPTNRCPEYYQNSGNNYSLNKPRPSMIAST